MNRAPRRLLPGRAITALAIVASSACEPPLPVIGVSTSNPYVDAARLAIADLDAEGRSAGFDTVMAPSGGNQAEPALEAAARMVAIDGIVAVIGHSNSAASLAAAPVYGEHEVVQISPTATAVLYSEAGPYSFRLVPPDDRQGAFIADELGRLLPDGGRVALFYINDDYGKGLRRALLQRVETTTLDIVVDLPHLEDDVSDVDIGRAGVALSEGRPDAIVWLARGTTLNRYLDAIRDVAPDVPILGSDALEAGNPRIGSARLAGVRSVTFVDLTATDELRAFSSRYAARYRRPASGADALTYDATRLVLAGLDAGARDGPRLRRYLMSLGRTRPPFEGITGPIHFDDQGDVERSYHIVEMGPEGAR